MAQLMSSLRQGLCTIINCPWTGDVLLLSPKCWDYRYVPLSLAPLMILNLWGKFLVHEYFSRTENSEKRQKQSHLGAIWSEGVCTSMEATTTFEPNIFRCFRKAVAASGWHWRVWGEERQALSPSLNLCGVEMIWWNTLRWYSQPNYQKVIK